MEKISKPGAPIIPINQGPYKRSLNRSIRFDRQVDLVTIEDDETPAVSRRARLELSSTNQGIPNSRVLPVTVAEAALVRDKIEDSLKRRVGYSRNEIITIAYSLTNIPVSKLNKTIIVQAILAEIDKLDQPDQPDQ